MKVAFQRHCNRQQHLHRGAFIEACASLLCSEPLDRRGSIALGRAFDVCDRKARGWVGLRELIEFLRVVRGGSRREKCVLVFRLYDLDASGSLDLSEMSSTLTNGTDLWESAVFAEQLVAALDVNGDGALELREFIHAVDRIPILFEVFANGLPIELDSAAAAAGGDDTQSQRVHDILQRAERARLEVSFSWDRLKHLWEELTRSNVADGTIASDEAGPREFRRVMSKFLNSGHSVDSALLDRLFAYFDEDGNGRLCLRELVAGLSFVFCAPRSDQAAFYFFLFDLDGSGSVSEEELTRVLLAEAAASHSSTMAATTAEEEEEEEGHGVGTAGRSLVRRRAALLGTIRNFLQLIDADGSGEVSPEEWVGAIEFAPEMIGCFEEFIFGKIRRDSSKQPLQNGKQLL